MYRRRTLQEYNATFKMMPPGLENDDLALENNNPELENQKCTSENENPGLSKLPYMDKYNCVK